MVHNLMRKPIVKLVSRLAATLLFCAVLAASALGQSYESDFIFTAPTAPVPLDATSYFQVAQQKSTSTVCSGSVSSGATSCTVVSVTGIAINDRIQIAGVGVGGANLRTMVTNVSGSVITWQTATSTTASAPAVIAVPMTRKTSALLSGYLGGTGVDNGTKTITLGGALTTTGAGAVTFALPGSTATYTFPGATSTLASLAGSEVLTNKTVNCANNTCTVRIGSDVTGMGTGVATALAINVGSAGAFVKNNGDALSGTFSGNFTLSGALTLTGLSSGTVAQCSGFATSSNVLIRGTCPGTGSALTTTDGTNSVANTTTQTFGKGYLVGGSAGSATIDQTVTLDTQSTTGAFAIPSTDGGALIVRTNASGGADTIANATGTLGDGYGTTYITSGFAGNTITPATAKINNLTVLKLGSYQGIGISSVSGNYYAMLGMPQPATQTTTLMLDDDFVWRTKAYPLASVTGLGTGVGTAAAANLSASGGLTTTIASGTSALGTSAISSAACATAVTTSAPNTATTDVVMASFNGDPTAVTGYIPLTAGMLSIISYPTSGNVNFKVCNNTSSSITPGAITLNWRVVR